MMNASTDGKAGSGWVNDEADRDGGVAGGVGGRFF